MSMTGEGRKKYSYRQIHVENLFKGSITFIGLVVISVVLTILVTLILRSGFAIGHIGTGFLWGKTWDSVNDIYGALPFLLGTLLTSFTALLISIPFSFSVAVLLGEYFPRGWFSNVLSSTIELIAAIPSVIYGFWGKFVLVPVVMKLETSLGIFPHPGEGIFTSSLVLAVMIIPYAASLGRSVIQMVPSSLKEAAYSLGATRWEVVRSVVLPYTKSGLFAGIILSLGRALGETMAVAMLIGNATMIPANIFSLGNSIPSAIALQLPNTSSHLESSALFELGLVLFLVTVIINMIGKRIIASFNKQ